MTTYKIIRVDNKIDLAKKARKIIASQIDLVLFKKKRFKIALSGGSTPSATYELLSQEQLPWSRVDIFLGDERWVDIKHEASNAGMITRTLLSSAEASQSKFYPVPTVQCCDPGKSSEEYSKLLENVCEGEPPEFDLIVLGLGDDGHTASLFPGSESLKIKDSWTTVSNAKGHDRITLTSPVLCAASKIVFLVSGSSKQIALKRLIDPLESLDRTPARLAQSDSEILVIADEQSCALI